MRSSNLNPKSKIAHILQCFMHKSLAREIWIIPRCKKCRMSVQISIGVWRGGQKQNKKQKGTSTIIRQLNMNRHLHINFIRGFIHLNQTLLCRLPFWRKMLFSQSTFGNQFELGGCFRAQILILEQVCVIKTAAMVFNCLPFFRVPTSPPAIECKQCAIIKHEIQIQPQTF